MRKGLFSKLKSFSRHELHSFQHSHSSEAFSKVVLIINRQKLVFERNINIYRNSASLCTKR